MKIGVAIAILMLIVLAVSVAMADDVGYNATVQPGQNTVFEMINGSFGKVSVPSTNNTITEFFKLKNNGNLPALIDAKFTTKNLNGIYGLIWENQYDQDVSGTGGSNFTIYEPAMDGQNTYNTTLLNTFTDVTLNNTVPYDSLYYIYGAYLDVPSGTPAGNYSGIVQITFSNA